MRTRLDIPTWLDVGLAVALTVVLCVHILVGAAAEPASLALACLLASGTALPLAFRRSAPVAVFAIVLASAAAYALLGLPSAPVFAGTLVATYTVALLRDRRAAILAALFAAAVLSLRVAPGLTTIGWLTAAVRNAALAAAAAAIGEANRTRRERLAETERARESEAALRVDEERLRIARELHDITAHSLSVIAIQSELGKRTLGADPQAAESALNVIGETSRQALGELRAILGSLRGEAEPHAPAPSLSRAGELVELLRDAGLSVESEVAVEADLPPFVDASAYRILQEAVTNVIRHSGARSVAVSANQNDGDLVLEVADDGVGPLGEEPEGHGLVGMRERAAALGGSFETGRSHAGGFLVRARLPLNQEGAVS